MPHIDRRIGRRHLIWSHPQLRRSRLGYHWTDCLRCVCVVVAVALYCFRKLLHEMRLFALYCPLSWGYAFLEECISNSLSSSREYLTWSSCGHLMLQILNCVFQPSLFYPFLWLIPARSSEAVAINLCSWFGAASCLGTWPFRTDCTLFASGVFSRIEWRLI